VQSSWTTPQQVPDAANNHMDTVPALAWMQLASAQKLFAEAGQDFRTLEAAAARPGFKAVPLGGAKASVSFDNDLHKHMSKNVIGVLPGKTAPDETVLFSAHWDHLGRCAPAPDGDNICNGAVDNASGVAALVALAEANVKAGPARRSLVFIALTGEESGLLGSEYYGANPVYPLAKTVGGVNMDALSFAGPARNMIVVGKGKSDLDGVLDKVLATQHRVATPEATPEKGEYYRSDHFSFAKHGVPMLAAAGGDDLLKGGKAAGAAAAKDYEDNRYHSPKDEYNPNWDWTGVQQDVAAYYGVGRALADGSDWPNWVTGDEFRAIRDKSRASAK
jgi:Zn-dependent M28 family amino/carboxypeptidase